MNGFAKFLIAISVVLSVIVMILGFTNGAIYLILLAILIAIISKE